MVWTQEYQKIVLRHSLGEAGIDLKKTVLGAWQRLDDLTGS